jgi:glyoxylase-like metal-dependent hydrolase (beta-lactamase superfamily II)
MSPKTSNRMGRNRPAGLLGAILAVAIVVCGQHFAVAAEGELGLTRLSDRLSVISGAGANVVVLETSEGLALVDSGAPARADALLAFIDAEFDRAPIRVLFNTHWRLDHTGANEAIARRGATIVAHQNTRLWMGTEYYVEWEQTNYPPRPDAALPTETFYSSDPQPLFYELGGYRIEYGHLAEAHTDGDIYVRFSDDDVIAVGDVLAVDAFPTLDYSTGGWIGGAQDATSLLLELAGPDTRIVAGEGSPRTRSALEDQKALLDELRERIRLRIIEGKSVDEILAEEIMEGYETLANPRQFVSNVYNGLWWGGRLRGAY